MKKLFTAYVQLTKTERNGFIALLALLLTLCCVRLTMSLWVKPSIDRDTELALNAAWEELNTKQTSEAHHLSDIQPILTPFDPNTLDSIGWRNLGLSEKTTRMILNWRRKGKIFYRKEDLKAVYTLSDTTFQRIEPYIRIGEISQSDAPSKKHFPKRQTLELNSASADELVALWGIGSKIARAIIQRREALGGFVEFEQLLEIYPFKDTVQSNLKRQLSIDQQKVRRININTADEETLGAHPYIGSRLAKDIVRVRLELGNYKNIKDLMHISLINEENYRKIAPYLTIE